MEGTVTITKDEYVYLKQTTEKMQRLMCCGVDNWDFYYDALNEEGDFEKALKTIEEEIQAM